MAQILRKIVATPSGYWLAGWAESKLNELDHVRRSAGAPTHKKTVVINGFIVLLSCTDHEKKYIILGGGDPLMLFANETGDTFWYNYLSDTWGSAVTAPIPGKLHAVFDGICHLAETSFVRWKQKWSAGEPPPVTGTQVANPYWYEMEMLAQGSQLYCRTEENTYPLASVSEGTLIIDKSVTADSGANLAIDPGLVSLWNLYNGAAVIEYDPVGRMSGDRFTWIPSIFSVDFEDQSGLSAGPYYGAYSEGDYYLWNAKAKWRLLCLLDNKDPSVPKQAGWVEMMTEYGWKSGPSAEMTPEGTPSDVISIFFDYSWPDLGEGFFYRSWMGGVVSSIQVDTGFFSNGYNCRVAVIQATTPGVPPDKVEMWNFSTYVTPDEEASTGRQTFRVDLVSGAGVIVVEGTKARLFRHRGGGIALVYETNNYHSHAVSQNGQLCAIFEKSSESPEQIGRMKLYDLRGRIDVGKGELPGEAGVAGKLKELKYIKSGYYLLRDGFKGLAGFESTSGCFIPFREKDESGKEKPLTPWEPGSLYRPRLSPDSREDMSSLGIVSFMSNSSMSPIIRKLMSTEPTEAIWDVYVDTCHESEFLIGDPDQEKDHDHFVSRWKDFGWYGVLKGRFTAEGGGKILFKGELDDGQRALRTIGAPSTVQIALSDSSGCLWIGAGALGEVSGTGCVSWSDSQNCFLLDADCAQSSCDSFTVGVITSCGATGSATYEHDKTAIRMTHPSQYNCDPQDPSGGANPGDVVTLTGAGGAWTYTPSCGKLSAGGGIINTDGCCGIMTITATNSCNSYSYSVRASGTSDPGQYDLAGATEEPGEDPDKPGCCTAASILTCSRCQMPTECQEGGGSISTKYVCFNGPVKCCSAADPDCDATDPLPEGGVCVQTTSRCGLASTGYIPITCCSNPGGSVTVTYDYNTC